MSDKELLMFLYNRLIEVHGEDELYDYMHRMRAIINKMDPKQRTPTFPSNLLGPYKNLTKFLAGPEDE